VPRAEMVQADLDSSTLVKIRVEGLPREVFMPMTVVFRRDGPPGPAARAFIAQLKQCSAT
jgi:DNA-binding transcriptional LysR family regulator